MEFPRINLRNTLEFCLYTSGRIRLCWCTDLALSLFMHGVVIINVRQDERGSSPECLKRQFLVHPIDEVPCRPCYMSLRQRRLTSHPTEQETSALERAILDVVGMDGTRSPFTRRKRVHRVQYGD